MGTCALTESGPLRCLTIDVEEYFHIEAAHGRVGRDSWDTWPSRVERNVDLLLDLLDRHGRRGTFFLLGHVAERRPAMVGRIADAGHEIACHGSGHDRLHRLDADSFRADVTACKHRLEDLTGRPVQGYRAPTFSVVPQTAWAIDVLADTGFTYDASIFPVRHPAYGVPEAPLEPFLVRRGPDGPTLLEVPPLVWRVGPLSLAVAGGGWFRLLPLIFMRRGLVQAARHGRPAILYFHPWEFDPGMPRLPLSRVGRFRTYHGLARSAGRLERIVARPARWLPVADALDELRRAAASRPVFDLAAAG